LGQDNSIDLRDATDISTVPFSPVTFECTLDNTLEASTEPKNTTIADDIPPIGNTRAADNSLGTSTDPKATTVAEDILQDDPTQLVVDDDFINTSEADNTLQEATDPRDTTIAEKSPQNSPNVDHILSDRTQLVVEDEFGSTPGDTNNQLAEDNSSVTPPRRSIRVLPSVHRIHTSVQSQSTVRRSSRNKRNLSLSSSSKQDTASSSKRIRDGT
jgi:hypothetical protein